MTNPSLETFKAFLQDDEIQEKYDISSSDVAGASMLGKQSETNMMVMLIREMVNKHTEGSTPKMTAAHLNKVLDNRI